METKSIRDDIWYELRSPSTQRPFYVKMKGEIVLWDPPQDAFIIDPPDGYFAFPPNSAVDESVDPFADAHKNEFDTRSGEIKSNFFQNAAQNDKIDILSLTVQNYDELLNIPYFPEDLFILRSRTFIKNFLNENILDQYTGTILKTKIPIETVLKPGKKALSGQLLKNSTPAPKNICQSLFKSIYSYITTSNDNSLTEFTKLIDGNTSVLADEAVIQLLTEANCVESSNTIINAWNLLLYVGAKYQVSEPIRKIIRSFSLIAACSEGVDLEIKDLATLCLLRFTSRSVINFHDLPLSEVMKQCTSMYALFKFSLSEILWKEEKRGIKHTTCVPQLLKKMVLRLKDLGAFKHQGIFRKPGSKAEQIAMAKKVNNGDWEIYTSNTDTAASFIVYFFNHIRESVVPPDMILKTQKDAPSYVSIANANSLSPENHDTLMYFIGMIQEFLEYKEITLMNTSNFVISFGNIISNIPDPKTLEEIKSFPPTLALRKMFSNLIIYWNTSDVYTPINQ